MNQPSRRGILGAIAAASALTLPPAIADSGHVAIEDFRQADAEHRAALERVETLKADLKRAEAELVEAERHYGIAARAVYHALRGIVQGGA